LNLFRKWFGEPVVDAARVDDEMMAAWSPLDHMTPQSLAQAINALNAGEVSPFARLWKDARIRDDLIPGVESKRLKDVSRKDWEIVPLEKGRAADRQKEVVEYFFDNLTCTDALDADSVGGTAALMRSALTAIGFGWSVQNIVWRPSAKGLTAEFVSVPLWFFERRKGRLRYLLRAHDYDGAELEDGRWLVTAVGQPLGVSSLILYLFKRAPLKDWAVYCRRYVIPGLHGRTPSKKGTSDWNSLKSALQNFGKHFNLVTGSDVEIKTIDAAARGELPYAGLADRCDKRLSALWRGGELSTMSSDKNAVGATSQNRDADILPDDDASIIEDVFTLKLIPLILRYTFGAGTEPLVKFRLPCSSSDVKQDLEVDGFFVQHGIPQGDGDIYERYGRSRPQDGETAVGVLAAKAQRPTEPMAHVLHATLGHTADPVLEALDRDLAPLRDRIAAALQRPDSEMIDSLHAMLDECPALFRLIDDAGNLPLALVRAQADAMEDGMKAKGDVDA